MNGWRFEGAVRFFYPQRLSQNFNFGKASIKTGIAKYNVTIQP
jgi:hypothetical protein